jgi:DNA-binding XRE family transcriptional regulator
MKTTASKSSRGAKSSASPLPNPVTLALRQNLKWHREAAKKTQVELAYDDEVERSRISKIECGYVNPSLLTLATLCYSPGHSSVEDGDCTAAKSRRSNLRCRFVQATIATAKTIAV